MRAGANLFTVVRGFDPPPPNAATPGADRPRRTDRPLREKPQMGYDGCHTWRPATLENSGRGRRRAAHPPPARVTRGSGPDRAQPPMKSAEANSAEIVHAATRYRMVGPSFRDRMTVPGPG